MLSFQKLDVYQRALQFLVVALEVISRLPKGHADLAAQLRASAQSTVANIAEGAGRRTRADAGHHYFMARGSAMESAAHLNVMTAMAVVDPDRYRRGIELLEGVVAMLTKMCDLVPAVRSRQRHRETSPSPSPSPSPHHDHDHDLDQRLIRRQSSAQPMATTAA